MFLFILKIEGISRPKLHSNTSHVLIYRIMALTELFSSWNSNTSHVLIYRLLMFLLPGIWANSNTSHVLIYPVRYCALSGLSRIQIHLMFLFIVSYRWCSLFFWCIQIHLMFLFIFWIGVYRDFWFLIQIHLMFLFILTERFSKSSKNHSNTSHVLIYLRRFTRYFF